MKRKMIMKIGLIALTSVIATGNIASSGLAYAQNLKSNTVTSEVKATDLKQIGGVASFEASENDVTLTMTTGEKVRVTVLDNNVLRIYMDPNGNFQENPTPNADEHITTILDKTEDEYEMITPTVEDGDILKISTPVVELRVDKTNGKMELFNKATNKVVWSEAEALKYSGSETIQTLETDESEYFYGGGVQNGRFSHKGKSINIKNENDWVDGGVASPTPFYFSSNGYGVMRHTFKPGVYDFAKTDTSKVTTKHNENRFDAYYFVDDNPSKIINEFTELTGKPILMPEYGFYLGHANCYSRDWINDETGGSSQTPAPGYDRQESLMVDAKKVVDDHISSDTPLGWFLPNDGYGCGYGREETIDGNIENLKQFVDYSSQFGIKTGLWTQSKLTPTGNQPAYLERDIAKEVGVAGTVGVKTDVAWVGAGYSFALNSVRQAAEGIMNNSKEEARPFVFSVDGWGGTQRYSGIWSGDQTGGQWEYIRFHIPTYIGSGLSGQPNIGSDMDGIFGGRNPVVQTRDFQWKAFTPLQIDMDGWGSSEKTPYEFDEPYTSINRMYLKMKAEMMPYVYSIANESTEEGTPMVRAMMLEEQNDYTYGTKTEYQYMWGPNLLVAPIYQETASDDKGNDIRNDIYLPDENQVWIDYFTGNQYRGGGTLNNFDAPVWKTPLFVKNGAIIPMTSENNSAETIDDSKRIVEVYPSGETSFEIYEDDGESVDYKSGKSATTLVTSSAPKTGEGKAVINIDKLVGDYDGIINERSTEFIVNVDKKPTDFSVKVGEAAVGLTEATSLEEFENGTNMYFYDETPNLNKYATEGSEFANIEITTTPKFYVKTDKVNVKENTIELTINDFSNTQELDKNELNQNLATPTSFNAPIDLTTPKSINVAWDAVEGATSYEVEVDGTIFKNITDTNYTHVNLEYDSTHTYRVRSINKDGYSDWSDLITVKSLLDPYRNVPKDMEVEWTEGHENAFYPSNAVDNNEGTRFMSKNPTAIDKPFIIDMKKAYQIEQIDVLCRNDDDGSGKGGIYRTELYSSLDGIKYEKVYTNAEETGKPVWINEGDPNVIKLDKPITARYFKLVAKDTKSGYLSIREFRPIPVDGTEGKLVGDWNNSGAIEEGDLTFLQNYVGVSTADADWDYVSMADLNANGLIDAYDISYVSTKLNGGVEPSETNLDGTLKLVSSKEDIKAGETFDVGILTENLSDVNAFSLEIPINSEKYEIVSVPTPTGATTGMKNLSKTRVHSDGLQDLYAVFTNVGEGSKISGNTSVAKFTLKAKVDTKFDLKATQGLLVDSNLNSKSALGDVIEVDKSALEALITKADELVETDYTQDTFEVFRKALEDAKLVYKNELATQEEVTKATTDLQAGIDQLVEEKIVISKVRKLKAENVTNNEVTLTFEDPKSVAGIKEYIIYKDGKEYTRITGNKAVISNLKSNTIYNFKVAVEYNNGEKSKPVSKNVRTKK